MASKPPPASAPPRVQRRAEHGAAPDLPETAAGAVIATRSRLWIVAIFILMSVLLSWLFHPTLLPNPGHWLASLPSSSHNESPPDTYLLGVGKADITGPVVEINLMGYADPSQVGTGLRQRLFSRAFIIGSPTRPQDRIVYLVLDTQSGDTAVRLGILRGVAALGPEYAMYGKHNVAVTGTHSHSGPGGWLNYLLPQVTSKGFDRQGFEAIVGGAVESVRRAHEGLVEGHLDVGKGVVKRAGINRSLYSYMANPAEERARYNTSAQHATGKEEGGRGGEDDDVDDGSTDRTMTLLRFTRASGKAPLGVLTWFATHGTSMLGNNTLISGDNKGVAAYLFERHMRTSSPNFVAGFSQSAVGDVSPNVLGAWCDDGSGERCSFENSTCASDGKSQHCHARGPFFRKQDQGAKSCFEIGRRQFDAARRIFERMGGEDRHLSSTPSTDLAAIKGDIVRAFHIYHTMPKFTFTLPNGTLATTCPAALGYSFAAGTSDGPGVFDFTQHGSGEGNTSPVWLAVRNFLRKPSDAQKACHAPKPILLDVGEMARPYEWTPNVVDVQVMRVGQLWIIVSSGEATTMAGRRWRERVSGAVREAVEEGEDAVVVLGGPANSYTHYITTEEEYGVQRYEGASTLYGPHTLEAYINVTLQHLPKLYASTSSSLSQEDNDSDEPFPPDNSNRSLSFIAPVVRDSPGLFKSFGDILTDPKGKVFRRPSHTNPLAHFVGANPRNNPRLEGTFAAVEQFRTETSSWATVRTDADWPLVYRWRRVSEVLATSVVEVEWEVEEWAEPGLYRLRYHGDAKGITGIEAFEGVSGAFTVV